MALVTGSITVLINGKSILMKEGEGELETGGFEREAVMADRTVIGPKEKPVAATCKGTAIHTSDTDILLINEMRDGTIVFKTDTGKTYVISHAFTTKPCSIKAGGDMSVEFAGPAAVES